MTDDSTNKAPFRAGQSVMCRVDAPEPGGYSATIVPHEVDAFLPSRDELTIGQTVPATFVCMSNNRALMTFAYMLGTTERVQFGLPSEEETAFAVWADSYPRNFKLRRAIDMIMPNIAGKLNHSIRCGELDMDKFLSELEDSRLTGCIKAEADEALSRSAALLYKGRVVGCIYTRKPMPPTQSMDVSLKNMLNDLKLASTRVMVYELPEEVVISMSALFLGIPIDEGKSSSVEAKRYIKEVLPFLEEREETLCMMIGTESSPSECLGFIYRGERIGSFSVVDQKFEPGFNLVLGLCDAVGESRANAYLLPKEMTSHSVVLGYSLGALPDE